MRNSLVVEAERYQDTIVRLLATADGSKETSVSETKIYALREDAHLALHIANRLLGCYPWHSPVRIAAQKALDDVLVELSKAKWLLGRKDATYADFAVPAPGIGLDPIRQKFTEVTKKALEIALACRDQIEPPTSDISSLSHHGTEILFADDTPLVPTICPVVIISGSNYDMGRQYAKQIVQIYGSWIFARLSQKVITEDERLVLSKWTAQIETAMPEIIDFARGWSVGAKECGIPLDLEHAISIWTGYRPPSDHVMMFGEDLENTSDMGVRSYLGGSDSGHQAAVGEVTDRCSGVCAWGNATVDGRLVAGSSTDHDCTFQATIVAYPDQGNAFIYTPFSVNGSTPILGRQFMAGHPGFNSKGVAYIHHGGASLDGSSSGGGPLEEWGYGVRRGAATFHTLQFANTAREAKDIMLSLPVGDPGAVLGTAGGMWADSNYGIVFEKRAGCPERPKPIIREVTYDKEGKSYDFLYANNNALSPDIASTGAPDEVNYRYTLEGGWHILCAQDARTDNPSLVKARMSTKNSAARNETFHRLMLAEYGKISVDYMQLVYRHSGTLPDGKYEEIVEDWKRGTQWNASAAHRGNAFTALMDISTSSTSPSSYQACIGPAARFLQVREPSHGYYYYDETNTFWKLSLANTPHQLMEMAEKEATSRIGKAQKHVQMLPIDHSGRSLVEPLLQQSLDSLAEGQKHEISSQGSTDHILADLAYRTRAFTRAQVRAAQVLELTAP